MTPSDPLCFVLLDPAGISVRGIHNPEALDVHPDLATGFAGRHAAWQEGVASSPGGYDGDRAVLVSFRRTEEGLTLRTAYRSYTQGRALRDTLKAAREAGTFVPHPSLFTRPNPMLSWGLSLSTYVLLPRNHMLCAQRSLSLAVAPGLWTASMSEVVEPSDINRTDMSPLLERLRREELPALAGLGTMKFVGLAVRKGDYVWQLVSVLDLRNVEPAALTAALATLLPDAETAAWAAYPLEPDADELRGDLFPEHMACPEGMVPADLATVQFLARLLPR